MRQTRVVFLVSAFAALFFLIFYSGISSIAEAKKPLPKEINISFVESPFNLQVMVMRERGLLEKAFGNLGVEVRWHNITAGAKQTMAMAARSLDIASVIGSTSVIMANAAGNRVEIAGIVSRPTRTFALLTGPKGPASIRELKGKTVAGPKGTVLHQMLAAALAAEGLSIKDVNFISMGLPDARTALLAGHVDAALQAASLIIRGEEAGLRVLFTADGHLTPVLLTAVRPEFARQYPILLSLYLKAQQEAYSWILANPKEAVAIGSKIHGISEKDGMRLYEWSHMAAALEKGDMKSMTADVKFLLDQDMIKQSVRPEDFVHPVAWGRK